MEIMIRIDILYIHAVVEVINQDMIMFDMVFNYLRGDQNVFVL
jgi:hypothetical protein